jgi:hypothetical protein
MSQDDRLNEPSEQPAEPREPLALEAVQPEIFREWQRRTVGNKEWTNYFLLMNAYAESWKRAPLLPEACEHANIQHILDYELECLADVIVVIFPNGIEGFRQYINHAIRRAIQVARDELYQNGPAPEGER